jgi:hypothetical protein
MSTTTASSVIGREEGPSARRSFAVGGLAAARAQEAGLPLVALALATFVIGTAELVVVGVLGLVARDLGVSAGTAGQLIWPEFCQGASTESPALRGFFVAWEAAVGLVRDARSG